MGNQEQIDRITACRDDIAAAITEQGIDAPSGTLIEELADLVREIPRAYIEPLVTADGYYLVTADGFRLAVRK